MLVPKRAESFGKLKKAAKPDLAPDSTPAELEQGSQRRRD
jgi:hypothetical protein